METLLSKQDTLKLVEEYIKNEKPAPTTQELVDSGAVPRLKGYIVKPGKVSDSIFGGKGSFKDKKSGKTIEFENPPLNSKDGRSLRLMVRTSRISTHDFNRGEIPFKDQILASNHNFMRKLLTPAIGTSQLEVSGLPDSAIVIVAENLGQLEFENVLRAYNAKSSTSTSLYQNYIQGVRDYCGHILPEGLIPNGPLPYVMDTPTTKSDEHDECIAPNYLFDNKLCTPQQYKQVINASMVAFGMVSNFLKQKGLIAVDTKTEHGVNKKNEVVSQDEIWTIDSSRFWLAEDYESQLKLYLAGKEIELANYIKDTQPGVKESDYVVSGKVIICPKSYSKEFARGFSKGESEYNDAERLEISVRYIESIQYLLGIAFKPDMRPRIERMISGLQTICDQVLKN